MLSELSSSVRLIAFGVILIGIAAFHPLRAQMDWKERKGEVPYTVLTTDGDTLSGMFVRWSGDTLVLRAQDTTLHRIRRGNIARVKERSTFEEVEKQDAATAFGISERGNKETRCGEERKWYI